MTDPRTPEERDSDMRQEIRNLKRDGCPLFIAMLLISHAILDCEAERNSSPEEIMATVGHFSEMVEKVYAEPDTTTERISRAFMEPN